MQDSRGRSGRKRQTGGQSSLWMRPLLPNIVAKGSLPDPAGPLSRQQGPGPTGAQPSWAACLTVGAGEPLGPQEFPSPTTTHSPGTVTITERGRDVLGTEGDQGRSTETCTVGGRAGKDTAGAVCSEHPEHVKLHSLRCQVKTINMEIRKVRISNWQVGKFAQGITPRSRRVTWKTRGTPLEIPKRIERRKVKGKRAGCWLRGVAVCNVPAMGTDKRDKPGKITEGLTRAEKRKTSQRKCHSSRAE